MPDRQKNALREKMAVREMKKLKNSQKKALKKEKKLEKASRPGRLFPILAAVLRDTPGGRPLCLHERASDGQRSSSGNAAR